MSKDEIYKLIQNFLKKPPTIIWGSGATIPFGLPSMGDLRKKLEKIVPELKENENLEKIIGEIADKQKFKEVKKIIWKTVYEKDICLMKRLYKDKNEGKPVKRMIEKFIEPHPQVLNIITTNYDRVLEYVLAINKYKFSDGFSGQNLSIFDENNLKNKNIINLIKVHGSLNWFKSNEEIIFISSINYEEIIKNGSVIPLIIAPSKKKFEETYQEPFRTLIQKSDEIINNSKSFFVVGFGFNDEHLTPKIDTRIKDDVPIVIITKKATESCLEKLKLASKYVLIEENEASGAKFSYKNKDDNTTITIDKSIWKLENFMEDVL